MRLSDESVAGVRHAERDDYEAAAEVLALAFADDPGWTHLIPDSSERAERLLSFFTTDIENLVPGYREVWVTDDGSGVAIWGRPGGWRVPFVRTLRPLPQMIEVFGRRLGLAIWSQLRLDRHHPRRPEHWYLHYLAVEPQRQGKGLGAALLAPMLERCDRAQTPAYLESSTERNRALYERHGFELTGIFPLPASGPPIREMWREPRVPGD